MVALRARMRLSVMYLCLAAVACGGGDDSPTQPGGSGSGSGSGSTPNKGTLTCLVDGVSYTGLVNAASYTNGILNVASNNAALTVSVNFAVRGGVGTTQVSSGNATVGVITTNGTTVTGSWIGTNLGGSGSVTIATLDQRWRLRDLQLPGTGGAAAKWRRRDRHQDRHQRCVQRDVLARTGEYEDRALQRRQPRGSVMFWTPHLPRLVGTARLPCCEPATSPFFNRRLIRLVRCEAVPSIAITTPQHHALRSQPSSRRLSIRLQRIAASENLDYGIAVLEDSPLLVGSLPANHSDAILRSAKGEIKRQ